MVATPKTLKIAKRATKRDRKALDRPFVAAIIREAARDRAGLRELTEVRREAQEQARKAVRSDTELLRNNHDKLKKELAEFEAASGLSINGWDGGKRLGEAVEMVRRFTGNSLAVTKLRSIAKALLETANELDAISQEEGSNQ
jgi:hypothetical protein